MPKSKMSLLLPAATIFGGGSVGLYFLRKWFQGGVCSCTTDLTGKTVVVTGANTGIGKETALDMAKRGARVILACRDLGKAEAAAKDIREEAQCGDAIKCMKLDLASLASVREFAAKFKSEEAKLHILVNNAGVMWPPKTVTEDGFELQMGTNHFGHFLLTLLLLGVIKKSAPSRIINVSSLAHYFGDINFDDINWTKSYSAMSAYGQSKLANVLFTKELAKRLEGTGVCTFSLHPGSIDTELLRFFWPLEYRFVQVAFCPFKSLMMKTPKQGAQTTIHCCVAPDIEYNSGLYYSDCAVKKASAKGRNDEMARKLWKLSLDAVNVEDIPEHHGQ